MITIGIDPGYHRCGYAVLADNGLKLTSLTYGLISTPATDPMAQRLHQLSEELGRIIKKYRPQSLAAEQVFFEKNRKTFGRVCQAQGVIMREGAAAGLPVFEYTPLQVKQALTGYGQATKNQVEQMAKRLLGINTKIKIDDTADALAVAICHLHAARLNQRVAAQLINHK